MATDPTSKSPATSAANASDKPQPGWLEHVPRTTAVLAVLAAVASGGYANQFSRTILAQAEADDQWSYHAEKSLKKHIENGTADVLAAMALGKEAVSEAELKKRSKEHEAKVAQYETELQSIKGEARKLELKKQKHQKQGDWFQYAFVILQSGVVLATISGSAKRRELWLLAVILGAIGIVMTLNAYFLFTEGLHWVPKL